MDELDQAILRELGREQVLLWGGFDPRMSANEVAARVGVDRSTVRLRVRAWEKEGFLLGWNALPNPLLFGVRMAVGGVRVVPLAAKARVLDDLALVDGMISAQEYVGEWIGLAFVDDGAAPRERRMQLLARLPGVAEVQPVLQWNAPSPSIAPSPLDWRILAALRATRARAQVKELAKAVGVSVNTFTSHYDALVRGNAVWTIPDLEFANYTGVACARVLVTLSEKADRKELVRAVRAHASVTESAATDTLTPDRLRIVSFIVQCASVPRVEEAEIAARGIPGVLDVEVLYPKRFRVYGAWLDERMAQQTSAAKPSSRRAK